MSAAKKTASLDLAWARFWRGLYPESRLKAPPPRKRAGMTEQEQEVIYRWIALLAVSLPMKKRKKFIVQKTQMRRLNPLVTEYFVTLIETNQDYRDKWIADLRIIRSKIADRWHPYVYEDVRQAFAKECSDPAVTAEDTLRELFRHTYTSYVAKCLSFVRADFAITRLSHI